MRTTGEHLLRELAPQVLGAVVRRYGDFGSAEDAVQEALTAAALEWPRSGLPDNPRAWLIQVAARKLTDQVRSESARRAQGSERGPDDQGLPLLHEDDGADLSGRWAVGLAPDQHGRQREHSDQLHVPCAAFGGTWAAWQRQAISELKSDMTKGDVIPALPRRRRRPAREPRPWRASRGGPRPLRARSATGARTTAPSGALE